MPVEGTGAASAAHGNAAQPRTASALGGSQDNQLPAFKLERYFAKWEFTAPHLLCCSDCEPLRLPEVLALADAESLRQWENLRLGYGETRGSPELVKEICGLYDSVSPEGVIVAAPQECVYLAMTALLRPGDHVVVTYPGYQSLFQVAASMGCQVSMWEVELAEDGSAAFDVDKFKALLRPTTRLAVVNFPHNPTGFIPSRHDWGRLVAACREASAVLFSDEMYRLMEFDESDRLPSAVDVYDKAITLSGLSKAFGLPGLRIGWLAVQPALRGLMDRVAELKDYTTICNSQPSEALAVMALRGRATILERNLALVAANCAALRAFMDCFPHVFTYSQPRAGSVAFPRLAPEAAAREDVEAFCDRVVSGCGVLLLPASVYDHGPSAARGHFRIGLGRRDLPKCLEVLGAWLEKEAAGK
ncbi:hypothetical protein CHLRE_01g047850v5 [Chlamydomonas reinhardtii]|uniref:Aminotransferase class I/classII large domain-containing protein n=1 Tax=Chlamydomonas reinhardtii TaxID=3055 RepID=A8HN54_CHLRE|nr:uncharacterized protein CHLRE_01g047850v5 [Chlamydomonas reinhardtii]PNW88857.1 hypothetical protein CHLRE_01g047850v5 [Chlamydomonas reinhardtii]|eukprot:XP_001690216.1 aminotransferase, classes I and II [Chlamydomonas reinhardtii]